jgi:hypothetical protein
MAINSYEGNFPIPFPLPILLCPPTILLGGDSPDSFQNRVAIMICAILNRLLYAFVAGFIKSRLQYAERDETKRDEL